MMPSMSRDRQSSHSDIANDNPVLDTYPKKCALFRYCVVAMRPLIVHASSKSLTETPRRALHIEYAERMAIADSLELAVAQVVQRLVEGEPVPLEVSGSRRCAALGDTSPQPQRRSRPSCSGTASRCQSRRRERSRTRRPSAAWRQPRASG